MMLVVKNASPTGYAQVDLSGENYNAIIFDRFRKVLISNWFVYVGLQCKESSTFEKTCELKSCVFGESKGNLMGSNLLSQIMFTCSWQTIYDKGE